MPTSREELRRIIFADARRHSEKTLGDMIRIPHRERVIEFHYERRGEPDETCMPFSIKIRWK